MNLHPIINRLKLFAYHDKLFLNVPAYLKAFDSLSFDVRPEKPAYDLIFAFVFSIDQFTAILKQTIDERLLRPEGYLYIAYPKKGNRRYISYIGRDEFFKPAHMNYKGYAMNSKLKFNKLAALDETFTCIGLKHFPNTKPRRSAPSQCISDYVVRLPDLRQRLTESAPELLEFFDSLPEGYRHDWARYVYAVRLVETSNKRFLIMTQALEQGYKSIDLYRRRQ